ncbi:MAG: hypothetical protein VXV85_01415 [Candidatus Thermoplasmatota archaeon]|nr:hypothetical protein [Candidatus Thermoplasmatota archaeon]
MNNVPFPLCAIGTTITHEWGGLAEDWFNSNIQTGSFKSSNCGAVYLFDGAHGLLYSDRY